MSSIRSDILIYFNSPSSKPPQDLSIYLNNSSLNAAPANVVMHTNPLFFQGLYSSQNDVSRKRTADAIRSEAPAIMRDQPAATKRHSDIRYTFEFQDDLGIKKIIHYQEALFWHNDDPTHNGIRLLKEQIYKRLEQLFDTDRYLNLSTRPS